MRSFGFLLLLSITLFSFGQNNRVEFGTGVSLTSATIKTGLNLKSDVEVSSKPVVMFSYHRHLNKGFWLGGEFTDQSLEGSYSFEKEVSGLTIKDTLSFNYKRQGYMASIFYAFPLENESLEIAIGLRAGLRRSKVSAQSSNDDVNELLNLAQLFDGVRPRPSIPIIVGYYPIKNVGLVATFNAGPTYVAKAGLSIKF